MATPASLAGAVDAISTETAGGEFAALLGAQLQPQLHPGAPAPETVTQALTTGPASAAKKALAAAVDAALPNGTEIAALDAIALPAPPSPTTVVSAAPPAALPSESELTRAAGGEDNSAEAADAAVAAAIDAGVAPAPGQRLVLAASLPISVQTSASVRVLDQLLDTFLPNPLDGAVQSADGAAAQTAIGAPAIANVPTPPVSSLASGSSSPRSTVSTVAASSNAATTLPQSAAPSAFAGPAATATEPVFVRDAVAQGAPLAEGFGNTATAPTSFTITARSTETAPHTSATPGLSPTDAPAFTPGTPPKGEPAALNNGKAAPRPFDMLRQRLEPLGMSGDIAIEFDRGGSAGGASTTLAALTHGNLIAPASAAALAAQGAASGVATGSTGSGSALGVGAATPGTGSAVAATMGEPQSFLGQGQSEGSDGWTDGEGLLLASGAGDRFASGAGTFDDLGSSFGTLLTSQSAAMSASRAPGVGAAPAMPATTPALAPDQLAVHIAAAARSGEQQIAVQLRPASLGRVEIQLSIGRDGAVRARITAERHETLDLLQRDAKGLEAAIEAAGLHAETGGLSFSLKDGGGQNGQPSFGETPLPASLIAALDGARAAATQIPQFRASSSGRALDIRV